MMYCPRCDKEVNFNSTAVSGPTRAYTLDLEGPVDPTIIRSSSKVLNVCKNCGSQNLHVSKAMFRASQRRAARKEHKENIAWKVLGVICLMAGIGFGIALASSATTAPPDSDAAKWGVAGSFVVGFLAGSISIGFIGALGIGMTDFD